jgi:flagellar hook-basal body complex protein FliE
MNSISGELHGLTAAAGVETQVNKSPAADADFANVLKTLLSSVNQAQQDSVELAKAFEQGEGKADLAQVMIASQEASLAFQATLQVRNKLIAAYQDIMNMPL